jgi:hypothetical protein
MRVQVAQRERAQRYVVVNNTMIPEVRANGAPHLPGARPRQVGAMRSGEKMLLVLIEGEAV